MRNTPKHEQSNIYTVASGGELYLRQGRQQPSLQQANGTVVEFPSLSLFLSVWHGLSFLLTTVLTVCVSTNSISELSLVRKQDMQMEEERWRERERVR